LTEFKDPTEETNSQNVCNKYIDSLLNEDEEELMSISQYQANIIYQSEGSYENNDLKPSTNSQEQVNSKLSNDFANQHYVI
jgi:hypothetical protein